MLFRSQNKDWCSVSRTCVIKALLYSFTVAQLPYSESECDYLASGFLRTRRACQWDVLSDKGCFNVSALRTRMTSVFLDYPSQENSSQPTTSLPQGTSSSAAPLTAIASQATTGAVVASAHAQKSVLSASTIGAISSASARRGLCPVRLDVASAGREAAPEQVGK